MPALPAAGPAEQGTVEVQLAVLHAGLCRDGIARMRADAAFARERVEPGGTMGGPALHLEGASYLLAGDLDRADMLLAQAAEVAARDREMNAASYALALRTLVAIRRPDRDPAGTLAEQALTVVRDGNLGDYVTSPLVYAVAAGAYLPRSMWSHDDTLQPTQDVEKARALVQASGFLSVDGITIYEMKDFALRLVRIDD